MLGDFILGLPVLCLLGSILYCGIHLWKAYQKPIHLWAHQMIERAGFWKTGMGRWRSLATSACLYSVSAVLSAILPVLIPLLRREDFAFTWTRDTKEFVSSLLFALITVVISLSMYGVDLSKATKRLSRLVEKVLIFCFPIILWIFFGFGFYKDFLSKGILASIVDSFFSTGDMFKLLWGCVSLFVMVIAVCKTYKDLWL